jgi:NADH:ubiquinone reductase (non-electrogenic)
MTQKPTKICILGGGFGGLYTALDLSRLGKARSGQWEITLVEPKDHFLFTPLLYELISGELQRWEIAPSYRQLLAGTKIHVKHCLALAVDFPTRQVSLEGDERLEYDYLVLAVGTGNRWPAIEGLADHALTFRSLGDVERLSGAIHDLERAENFPYHLAIVGGGPNGVELACKVADHIGDRGKVHLIERNEEILGDFPTGVRIASYRSLLARNVSLYLQTGLEAVTANSIALIKDNQRQILPVDRLIWTAGTEMRHWIIALDCQKSPQGKLLTQPTLQLLDYPEVFALGDLAEIYSSQQSIPATAQSAYQAARIAAHNLSALIRGRSLKPYRYIHLGDMLTLGKKRAIVWSFGVTIGGKLGDIIRRLVYILRLPTQRQKIKVLQHWLKNLLLKLRFQQGLSQQPIESKHIR